MILTLGLFLTIFFTQISNWHTSHLAEDKPATALSVFVSAIWVWLGNLDKEEATVLRSRILSGRWPTEIERKGSEHLNLAPLTKYGSTLSLCSVSSFMVNVLIFSSYCYYSANTNYCFILNIVSIAKMATPLNEAIQPQALYISIYCILLYFQFTEINKQTDNTLMKITWSKHINRLGLFNDILSDSHTNDVKTKSKPFMLVEWDNNAPIIYRVAQKECNNFAR